MRNDAKYSKDKRERAKAAGGKPLNMILDEQGRQDLERICEAKGVTIREAVQTALRRMAARIG